MNALPSLPRCATSLALLVGAFLAGSAICRAADSGATFATPDAAVEALAQAVTTTNHAAFAVLFGDATDRLVNPDSVQGATELATFAAAFQASHRLVPDSDNRRTLEVGTNSWPFPIPLIRTPDGWRFDTAAGVDEILNRRIGRNEIEALALIRAYVDGQREYASRDRDGDEVLEYAQQMASSPGRTDGLYWSPELTGEISPLGPLAARAQAEGYRRREPADGTGPRPFHGYLFRILKSQGRHAPGGRHDYVINGNMIAGFALVAWPAEYGNSGVMTFIVNQQGRVHQRDLGPRTARLAAGMKDYDPGPGWELSRD